MNTPGDWVSRLRGAPLEDRTALIDAAEATVNRQELAVVAECGYLQEEGAWKDAATRFFIRSAPLYFPNLSATFHVIPWASGHLLNSAEFEVVYHQAHGVTQGFSEISAGQIGAALRGEPRTLVVFRMIAALSRNQISYILSTRYGLDLSGDDLRILEREGTEARPGILANWSAAAEAVGDLLHKGVTGELMPTPDGIDPEKFKTLTDKVDTLDGWASVAELAERGVPYYTLLYQRYVGGTFGQAVNTSTALKADLLEDPVEQLLRINGVPFYRVGAREKLSGWEQAPDFLVPGREDPEVVVEAKVAEDGGTARDKASRIERLARTAYRKGVTPIAVIDGLGFFRVNDVLAPILANTEGRVYSASNLAEMMEVPQLAAWRGQSTTS